MHIDWRELQTIEALVRRGSLVSAAEELGLSHSSVSRRLAGMERTFGTPLFLHGSRLRPTPMAKALAARAAEIRSNVGDIEQFVTAQNRRRSNGLGVTTNDVLMPFLSRAIGAADLEQRVRLHVSDSEESLDPGRFDFALRPTSSPGGDLRGSRLGTVRIGVYRSVGDDREGCPWLIPSPELRSRASMSWLEAVPEDAMGGIECSSLLSIRDACVAGLGRAVLPTFVAICEPRLALERALEPGPPLWLLSPASRRSDPVLKEAHRRLRGALLNIKEAWA